MENKAFRNSRKDMKTTIVLATLDSSSNFIGEIDSLGQGIGATFFFQGKPRGISHSFPNYLDEGWLNDQPQ